MNTIKKITSFFLTKTLVFLGTSLLMLSHDAIAQEKIECTKLFNSTDSRYSFKYAGHDSKYIYWFTTFNSKDILHIKIVDIENKTIHIEKKLNLPPNYAKSDILKLKMYDGKISIVSTYFNEGDKKYYIFRETIDIEKANTCGDLEKIAEMPATNKKASWSVVESEDKSFYAFLMYNYEGFEYSESQLLVLKNDFSLLYQADLLKNLPGVRKINEIIVDNEGNVYSMIMSFKSLDDAKDYEEIKVKFPSHNERVDVQTQKYQYQILFTDNMGNCSNHVIVPPQGKFIKYASVFVNDTTKIICGALCNIGSLNNSDVFSYKLENKIVSDITITDSEEISLKLQTDYLESNDRDLYDEAQENKKSSLWDYHNLTNRGMIKFNDGYIAFIEKTLQFIYAVNQGKAGTSLFNISVNDYVYGLYIDSTGTIGNLFIIPKKQSKKEDPNFKSSYWVKNDKLYFLFSTDNYMQRKMEKTICYIYDKDFNRTSVEIPSVGICEKGFTTGNIWVDDRTLIGCGLNRPNLQSSFVYLIKLNID